MQGSWNEHDHCLHHFCQEDGTEHRIPFEASMDPFYSKANLAHLRRSVAALDADHGLRHELTDHE